MGRGLSDYQKMIVRYAGSTILEYRERGWDSEEHWGARWHDGQQRTRSEHAPISRALRRLETRGLIVRRNRTSGPSVDEPPRHHGRTTHVLLTDAGWEAYKRLTTEMTGGVNQ